MQSDQRRPRLTLWIEDRLDEIYDPFFLLRLMGNVAQWGIVIILASTVIPLRLTLFIALLMAAGAAPVRWLLGWREVKPAVRICAGCGYDLRASLERCPECGTPIPSYAPPPMILPIDGCREEESRAGDERRSG